MTRRVLVTGGSGFVGRYCLEHLLARHDEVHAVSRTGEPSQAAVQWPSVQWHRGDLFDVSATRELVERLRPTHLLHLAWYTEPGLYWTSPENARWVEASVAMLRAFLEQGRRCVMVGTSAEYNWSHGTLVEDETPLCPQTPYGIAKLELRIAAESLARDAGVSLAWGRLFGVYGPGEPAQKLASRVIDDLLHGRPFRGRTPDDARDFLYVADAARAFALLVDSDFDGAVNVGSGQAVTIRRFVDTIANEIGRPELVQADPSPSGDAPLVVADVRRLTAATGFSPAYTLEEGIRETVARHRGSGGGG